MKTNFFNDLLHNVLVSPFKVSNASDKYLLRHSIIKDCLKSDVYHLTSQILPFFIDSIRDCTFLCHFFGRFSSFQTLITLEPETILRNSKR